jgi:hypothetical protein
MAFHDLRDERHAEATSHQGKDRGDLHAFLLDAWCETCCFARCHGVRVQSRGLGGGIHDEGLVGDVGELNVVFLRQAVGRVQGQD